MSVRYTWSVVTLYTALCVWCCFSLCSEVGSEKQLIMGLCEVSPRDLSIFLRSIRASGMPDAVVVCLLYRTPPEELVQVMRDFGPGLFYVDTELNYGMDRDIVSFRFSSAYRYLLATQDEQYDKVVLMDVRDAIFQRNLFPHLTEPGVYLAREYQGVTMADCPINHLWIRTCYTDALADQYMEHRAYLFCSGLIAGTFREFKAFLGFFVEHVESKVALYPQSRCINMRGFDQGVLNHLVQSQELFRHPEFPVFVWTAETGPVLHVAQAMLLLEGDQSRRDNYGRILNLEQSQVVAVVHQYDRVAWMDEYVHGLYPWLLPNDYVVQKQEYQIHGRYKHDSVYF